MNSRKSKGNTGEDLAVAFLKRLNYEIIDRNFRTEIGEIDIIASCGGCLVFVEVKVRKNAEFGYASEAVGKTKQRRITQVASQFLARKMIEDCDIRFDIIEIYIEEGEINHIENAFEGCYDY